MLSWLKLDYYFFNLLIKRFIYIVLLLSFITRLEAAIFTHPAILADDNTNRCVEPISRRLILPDKEYNVKGICAAVICNLETSTISIETCPHIDMPDCTEVPVDLGKPFPKCCSQFHCYDQQTGEKFQHSL